MTGLAVVTRHDQNWVGLAIVLGAFTLAVLVEYAWRRIELWADARLDPILDQVLGVQDHVNCTNPDCAEVICRCTRPSECVGCTTLGCVHGEGLCWECRVGCRDCAAEVETERHAAWAAGR